MKILLTTIAGAVALLTSMGGAAIMITNPDYVIVVTHDYEGPETNFGGGFGATDNGAFRGMNTVPTTVSCTTGSDGICRLPSVTINGRSPGEIVVARDILWGFQFDSFSQFSRGSDNGLYAPMPPETPPFDPAKCIADICGPARAAQQDNNAIQLAKTKALVTIGKWGTTLASGFIGSLTPAKVIGGVVLGGGAYMLTRELGSDLVDSLDQSMRTQVAIDYAKCRKKCGG